MYTLQNLLSFTLVLLSCFHCMSQPFELDPKIKPIELLLLEDKEVEGAKGVTTMADVTGDPTYFFVKGHDIFQFIDVYVFSNFGDPSFTAELVKDTWAEVVETQTSTKSKDGIMNFKLRTWGDFGIKVISPEKEHINFTISVYAGPPVKEYINSPFVQATDAQLSGSKTSTEPGVGPDDFTGNPSSTSNNFWLYGLLGLFLLIIGVLAGKLLGKKKHTVILLVLVTISFESLTAQQHDGGYWNPENVRNGAYKEWMERNHELNRGGMADLGAGIQRMESLSKKMADPLEKAGKAQKSIEAFKEYYDSYKGLSNCINSTSPPGAPTIPSFCITGECGQCFIDARQKFNFTLYQFEKLNAIYNCTINYSNKAMAVGDNLSGYHGISGMAWQIQRTAIEKSVKELQEAFDNRYGLLMKDLQESMQMLNACEAEHGLPDWFDRFGYMYYDFIKNKYQRTS